MEFQNIVRTVTRLIFAAGGLIFLFQGSFSKLQFQEDANWKGMCFIILSLSVAFFVFMPLKCNDMFEKLCDMHFLVNAVVKLLLLGFFSMVIFFTKYPGLKIHSKSRDIQEQGKRSGKVNDLLGVGSFSVLALVISWERQQGGAAGFGVFEFILELTMDASMEIPAAHDDGSGPNLWYTVGAYVFCFLLLIIRSYHGNSLSSEHGILISTNSVGGQETLLQDQDQLLGADSVTVDIEQQLRVPLRNYSRYFFYSDSDGIGTSTTTSSSGRILENWGSEVSSTDDGTVVDGGGRGHESSIVGVLEGTEENREVVMLGGGESNDIVQMIEYGSNLEIKGEEKNIEVMLDGPESKDVEQWGNYKGVGLRKRRMNTTQERTSEFTHETEHKDAQFVEPYSYIWDWKFPIPFTYNLVSITLTNGVFRSLTDVLSIFGCSLFPNDDQEHKNGEMVSTPLYVDTTEVHFQRSAEDNRKGPWICWCWEYDRFVYCVKLEDESGNWTMKRVELPPTDLLLRRDTQLQDNGESGHWIKKRVELPLPRKVQLLRGTLQKPELIGDGPASYVYFS